MQIDPTQRFVLGATKKARLELDFFNLYAWLLQYVDGKKVLDIACGSGLGSFLLAHKAASVEGVDYAEDSVAFAQERYRLPNLQFRVDDLKTIDLRGAQYDLIICSMTLEQLDARDHEQALKNLHGGLVDAGMLILITPNKHITSPGKKVGGHQWNAKEYYRSELEDLCAKADFEAVEWYGRRRVFAPLAWYPIRKGLGLLQRILRKNFGLYGSFESAEIRPIGVFWQAKDFVVLLKPMTGPASVDVAS